MNICVKPKKSAKGLFSVPGDKSVSHRAVMLSSLTEGKVEIEGFLPGEDCISTISCLRALGVQIDTDSQRSDKITVHGKGLYGLEKPSEPLFVGNSGTTIRLLSGILAAQVFDTEITGDASVCSRPMTRIIEPLTLMGAEIISKDGRAPLLIKGNPDIKAISFQSKIASAQVKSCILLAGLYANGETIVSEPVKSRDHTEIMLRYLGSKVKSEGARASVIGKKALSPHPILICGDISSAAFLIAAALLLDNSEIIITNVGVNATRTGILTVLLEMGAEIDVLNRRSLCGEYVADIRVRSSRLVGIEIGGSLIPSLIDEIPVIAAVALFASGKTIIKDAAELKVKETNRIDSLVSELKKMGGNIEATDDGMIIEGGGQLRGAEVDSRGDHRIAMSLAVAALKADGETFIKGAESADISFPGFYEILESFN